MTTSIVGVAGASAAGAPRTSPLSDGISVAGVAGASAAGAPITSPLSTSVIGVAGASAPGVPSTSPLSDGIHIVGVAAASRAGTLRIAAPWINYSDPLYVSIDQAIAGQNFPDNRSIWYDLTNVTFGTGNIEGAQWYKDSGPIGVDDSILEPRAFCVKGQASFTFTGRTLIVRLNIAFSWFTGATVTIDGVAPSTLDLLSCTDTLSCDAATYELENDGYIDVLVADGLANTAHTCVITINSSDAAKFFSMSGFKVGVFTTQPLSRTEGWLVPASFTLTQNKVTLTIKNRGSATVANPSFSFPSGLVTGSDTSLTTLTTGSLSPSTNMSQVILPVFAGTELSSTFTYHFTLVGQYYDPDGVISQTVTVTAAVGNIALTVIGTWFQDTGTPGNLERLFTDVYGPSNAIEFTFVGDALTLVIQQSAGWSTLGIYASDNVTLLNSVNCGVDTGGLLATIPLTGFGGGSHTVFLRKSVNDGLFVVFLSASWSVTETFTQITETVVLNYSANQPVAMSVIGASVGTYDLTFNAPIPNTTDYSGTPVRENTNLAYTEVLSRFPTFAVYYKTGFADLLSHYDILIVDPLGAHAADVIAWQAQGIKVFGYISSGEESGFYSNRYDFTSALGPNQGEGPGGYATYFMYTQAEDFPDEDGVFAAYFVNPDPTYGWPERIESYYAPQVLGGPVVVTNEVVTTKQVSITAGEVIVFDTAQSPLDADETITLKTMDGSHTYVTYSDYTFDAKTGAFVLSTTISPSVTIGQQLKISYTRKGHHMDGVFFDTVDTPDVYGGNDPPFPFVVGYATLFAEMINNFKAANPSARIISNRGFTILPDIIQSCVGGGVMFESWLTLPTEEEDLNDTDYFIITDPDTVALNDGFNEMLRTLRLTHEFDVFSLNYCLPGSAGNALRAYCRAEDAKRGYLSWQAIITLTTPADNFTVTTPGFPIASNAFTRYKTKAIT